MSIRSKVACAAAAGVGLAAASYGASFAATWFGYGRTTDEGTDPLLDRFMPAYEVAEHHQIRVAAPPDITFASATNIDLLDSRIIHAIFTAREWILRSKSDDVARPTRLLAQMKSIGWTVLAEVPGREIVVGSVTQPWKGNPTFRPITPDKFKAFHEPEYVKIAWTLRADAERDGSIASTETRACTTDAVARAKFRRYWSFVRPGVVLIRRAALAITKRDAEINARQRAFAY